MTVAHSTKMGTQEARRYAGCSNRRLNLWVSRGLLSREQVDGVYVYDRRDLDEAMALHDPRGDLCFTDDYNHLRDYGLSHREIAERMGMGYESFMKRVSRMGLYRGTPYEAHAEKVLDRLIASGEPFVSEALPCLQAENVAAQLVKRAVNEKRIRPVGKRKSQFAFSPFMLNVYVGVAA